MILFFRGMVVMGFLIAGLFFFRFWRRTSDNLFGAFGAAFLLFALNDALIAYLGAENDYRSWTFVLRFVGFGLIILAMLGKNLGRPEK